MNTHVGYVFLRILNSTLRGFHGLKDTVVITNKRIGYKLHIIQMSQKRLQQDIEKLLKKVKEGLEEFDLIYDKFQMTDPENISHREKLESDLKREVKKLQKHREQIKTWISKEDLKDKANILLENRKLIENDMERFKSIERMMKTKQFSKEALTNPDIIKDPRDLQKRDLINFIQSNLEELKKQLESYEAHNSSDIEHYIERHEYHISNLENILKLLQNGEIDSGKIEDYRDDITYYVENNGDPDFVEYDTLYEDMGVAPKKSRNGDDEELPVEDSFTKVNSVSSDATSSSKKDAPPTPKKEIANNSTDPVENSTGAADKERNQKQQTKATDVSEKDDQPKLSFPEDKTEEINAEIEKTLRENPVFKNSLFGEELKYWLESKKNLVQPPLELSQDMISRLESSLLNCPDSLDADSPYLYRKPLSLPHPTSIFFPNDPIRFINPVDIPSAWSVHHKKPGYGTTDDSDNQTSGEDKASSKALHKYREIYANTSLAKIFTKFDLDTLFFIFYHYQGSYEQFLAANELNKNRNWQFHKHDRCWYYKEIEKLPPGMNKAEEVYWRYFDYRKSWLARRCGPDFIYKEEDFEKF